MRAQCRDFTIIWPGMLHYERENWGHCRHGAGFLPLFVPKSCDLGAKTEMSGRNSTIKDATAVILESRSFSKTDQLHYIWRAGMCSFWTERGRSTIEKKNTSQERRLGYGTGILPAHLQSNRHSKSGKRVDVRQTAVFSPTFEPECYTSRAESRA